MILPATFLAALVCSILSMLCWGSWANTLKLSGKWRFELFYYDFSFGLVLTAIVAAVTLGSMGEDLSVYDNLLIASRMKMGFAGLAGAVFNLANMLLVAAIAVAGMAVAFPIAIGLALVIGVVWNYILNPQANPMLLFVGVAVVLAAILVDARAYASYEEKKKKTAAAKSKAGLKGIALGLASGVLMGCFYPLVEMSKQGETGLGAYTVMLLFAGGVFFSTFFYNLYFLNLPVQGPGLAMFDYFQGSWKQHLLGLAGGVLWCIGGLASFAAASAPRAIQVGPAVAYALGQGATLISALWGLLLWREFAGASRNVRMLLWGMILLFVVGLALISIAPLYVRS